MAVLRHCGGVGSGGLGGMCFKSRRCTDFLIFWQSGSSANTDRCGILQSWHYLNGRYPLHKLLFDLCSVDLCYGNTYGMVSVKFSAVHQDPLGVI